MTPLPSKRDLFVVEYLVDLNATQAAIRAGYSAKTAYSQGQRLLKNVDIAAAIQKAAQARVASTTITAEKVIQELARIGLSDMRKFAKWGPGGVLLVDSDQLTEDEARAVSEVSEYLPTIVETTKKDGTVQRVQSGGSRKFKLHSKEAALALLAKHFGLLVDKTEGEVRVTHVIRAPSKAKDAADWKAKYPNLGKRKKA